MAAVVDVVILAAGRSSRMGGPNKLLARFGGVPLVRRSAATALGSSARRVRIVVGHMREEIEAALAGLDVDIVINSRFGEGLSTSLIAGFGACGGAAEGPCDGVLVMLSDQPFLDAAILDRLISAFRPGEPGAIVVATAQGKRGNPVLLSSAFAADIAKLTGDVGAKHIVDANGHLVEEVEIGDAAAIDVDTPEALAAAGGAFDTRSDFAG